MNKLEQNKFKIKHGIPTHAKFSGYVIYILETDEFIHSSSHDEDIELTGYTQSPIHAEKYSEFENAKKKAQCCKYGTEIEPLFESDTQYYIYI